MKKTSPLLDTASILSQRLSKAMSHAGLCSRREAERWIQEGRVTIDGQRVTTPVFLVTPQMDVRVDGKPLSGAPGARLWRYHKPREVLVTTAESFDKINVFQRLKKTLPPAVYKNLPRLIAVGRLDFLSEGLLLFSNNGEITRFLELPSTAWKRRYRVRVFGEVTPAALEKLAKGITIDGMTYGPVEATIDTPKRVEKVAKERSNTWLTVSLKEGKNREIRRMMEHFGWAVSRLIRLSYGPFLLGDLQPGQLEEVPQKVLKESFGKAFYSQFL